MNTYKKYRLLRHIKRNIGIKKNRELVEKNHECRILVVLHLFYSESWDEICEYLKNLDVYQWKLIITCPEENFSEAVLKRIREWKPDVLIRKFPNRGYDVAPFLFAIRDVDLSEYDVVFKLQSKGIKRRIYIYRQILLGRDWFINLFEGILGAGTVHQTIDVLMNPKGYRENVEKKEKEVGLVAAENLLVHDPVYKEHIVREELLSLKLSAPENYLFVAGTCFALRSDCLQKCIQELQLLQLTPESFRPMVAARGLSLAHILERYFCISIQKQGFRVCGNPVCRLRRSLKRPLEAIMYHWSSERLLELPYHIDDYYFLWQLDNNMIKFRIRKACLADLRFFYPDPPQLMPLDQCYPYRYLEGDVNAYQEYCKYHEINDLPVMSPERYDKLITSIKEHGYDSKNIIIISEFDTIMDGQHRAGWLAYEKGLSYTTDVLEISILNKRRLLEEAIPRPIRIYLEKRYLQKRCQGDR